MKTVITFIYSRRPNVSMLTGRSSSGYRKLQNRIKYYYAFIIYAVILFVSIFHIIDSLHFSANNFHNYQKFRTFNIFLKSMINSNKI